MERSEEDLQKLLWELLKEEGQGWETIRLGRSSIFMYVLNFDSAKMLSIADGWQCDPEAAQAIFLDGDLAAKTTLIPLDLTHQVLATHRVQQQLLHGPAEGRARSPTLFVRPLFHDLLIFFAATYREVFGLVEGPPLHDPNAIAVLLSDAEISFDDRGGERWNVQVVTDGLHSEDDAERGQVGRTIISKANGKGVRIPRGVDVQRLWDMIEDCVQRAEGTQLL